MGKSTKALDIRTIGTIRTSTSISHPLEITTVFGNYVTQNHGFVEYLGSVRDQIETYCSKTKISRPLNILLAAPPGSGKSFLIKQIIGSINSNTELSFEEVYVASLENAAELFSIFQRIQSINLEGKIPVVFFDEIDSKIGGTHIYAKFLAPMWDGTFYLGKERFFLGRSIFFFAGSTLSLEKKSREIVKTKASKGKILTYDAYFSAWNAEFNKYVKRHPDKLHDFMDRIDAVIPIPPVKRELLGIQLKKEYEDLGCMLILKHFPNTKYIGKIALRVISDSLAEAFIKNESVRVVEKAIFSSRIDGDTFDLACLPKRFRQGTASTSQSLINGAEKSVWEIVRKRAKISAHEPS
jgi:hypothetical protein